MPSPAILGASSYVGNAGGVLIYDGAWWRLIPIGKAHTVFSLASDARGRIGVGGDDELGLLAPDGGGSLRYLSLVGLLPPEQRTFGQVLRIAATEKGFAYITRRWLFLWDGSRITTVATFPGDRPYAVLFPTNDSIVVWTRAGILRLAGEKLVPVPGGEVFRDRRADLILPADPAGDGLLVSVRGEGLFLLRNGVVQPFAAAASRWTAEKKLLQGVRLADGRWALGSILGGLLLLRPDGTVDQVIDASVGLSDNFVSGAMVDREGSLWLSLNNGIARVETASPLSIINRRAGLEGTVYSVTRHLGKLWIGTAAGLFTNAAVPPGAARAASEPKAPEWGGGLPVQIRAVPGAPPAVWSLLSVDQDLLVGTAFGPYLLRGESLGAIAAAGQETLYVMARSRRDPDRVWLGTSEGLGPASRGARMAVRRHGAGHRPRGPLDRGRRGRRPLAHDGARRPVAGRARRRRPDPAGAVAPGSRRRRHPAEPHRQPHRGGHRREGPAPRRDERAAGGRSRPGGDARPDQPRRRGCRRQRLDGHSSTGRRSAPGSGMGPPRRAPWSRSRCTPW